MICMLTVHSEAYASVVVVVSGDVSRNVTVCHCRCHDKCHELVGDKSGGCDVKTDCMYLVVMLCNCSTSCQYNKECLIIYHGHELVRLMSHGAHAVYIQFCVAAASSAGWAAQPIDGPSG